MTRSLCDRDTGYGKQLFETIDFSGFFLGNIVVYKITCGDQEFQVQTDPSSDPMVNPNELIDLRLQENRVKLLA